MIVTVIFPEFPFYLLDAWNGNFWLFLFVNIFCFALQIIRNQSPNKRRRSRSQPSPTFVAEPVIQSNSFVGTEEYIAPVWWFFHYGLGLCYFQYFDYCIRQKRMLCFRMVLKWLGNTLENIFMPQHGTQDQCPLWDAHTHTTWAFHQQ